ncbi:MAG: PEP-CTERM sorting domain-containing protein [Verrucomicrobiae bacterium]|nr:PEP-CTERM sorting domain-containing protein [Verrucomicrobiae bacterium]
MKKSSQTLNSEGASFVFYVTLMVLIMTWATPGSVHATLTNDFQLNRTLVTDTTRNGGFETTNTSNWVISAPTAGTTTDTTATNSLSPGPSAPSEGSWFGLTTVSGATGVRIARNTHRNRSQGLTLDDGNILRISADFARPDTLGLTTIHIVPQLYNGNTVVDTLDTFAMNIASSNAYEWVTIAHDWVLPNLTFNGVDIRIDMRSPGSSSSTYTGYLDNLVVLQGQVIPEPSVAALTLIALVGWLRLKRRRV